MSRVTTRLRHDAGLGAAGPWRRALACLLCICLLVSSFQVAPAADNPVRDWIAVVTIDGISHTADPSSDNGPAQHCGHCVCHQLFEAAVGLSMPMPLLGPLRFTRSDADVTGRPTAPPPRPPRA